MGGAEKVLGGGQEAPPTSLGGGGVLEGYGDMVLGGVVFCPL